MKKTFVEHFCHLTHAGMLLRTGCHHVKLKSRKLCSRGGISLHMWFHVTMSVYIEAHIYMYIYKQIYNHRNYLCNKVRTNTQNGFYDLGLGLLAFKMSIPTINFLSPQRNLINCNENNFFKMDGFQQLCRYRANGAGHVVALDQTIE